MERDDAMRKVRKLLAIATDGRGNLNEAEAAMRQAQAMMRQHGIDEAEATLADAASGANMVREDHSPYAYSATDVPTKVPSWVGVVAVGVARLAEVRLDVCHNRGGPNPGARVRFSGHASDVPYAGWLYVLLTRTVHRLSRERGGSRADRESFRRGCAAEVQRRLYAMAAERDEAAPATPTRVPGTSLAVVQSAKARAVEAAFGRTQVSRARPARDAAVAWEGREAGRRVAIPSGRPVGGGAAAPALPGGR